VARGVGDADFDSQTYFEGREVPMHEKVV